MTDDLPRLIRRLDLDRMRRYQEALELYAGNHWPGGPARGRRRTLTVNYIRTVIDKVSTYLMAGGGGRAGRPVRGGPGSGHRGRLAGGGRAERAGNRNRHRRAGRRGLQGLVGPRGRAGAGLGPGRSGPIRLAGPGRAL
mgnify:CR=1 FL=1